MRPETAEQAMMEGRPVTVETAMPTPAQTVPREDPETAAAQPIRREYCSAGALRLPPRADATFGWERSCYWRRRAFRCDVVPGYESNDRVQLKSHSR